MTYTISSDHHLHEWNQFSKISMNGHNSRLDIILEELERQAATLLAAGGNRMFMAGDTFHVRGSITPNVLNPTIEAFKRICASGVDVYAITGNHDLSSKHSEKLGNAMQALDEIEGFVAVTAPELFDDVMMIPWIEDLDELRAVMKLHANPNHDLIIHAPVNGVIKGIPDLGLTPEELAALGYRRVFVGHYHCHRVFDGGVFSIGATTHQTWSDVETHAGFLMVDGNTVTHIPSNAPQFVNLDDSTDLSGKVTGNYVRIRYKDVESEELVKLKAILAANGALGWVDHSSKKRDIRRGNAATPANLTLEVSVASYVENHLQCGTLDKDRIVKEALDVLTEARTAGDE